MHRSLRLYLCYSRSHRLRQVSTLEKCPLTNSYVHYSPASNASTVNLYFLYFAGFLGIKAEFEVYACKDIDFNFRPGSIRCPQGCSGRAPDHSQSGAEDKVSH
jgi:hypothetical protein